MADGKTETILADADSVRLVPGRADETMAQVTPPAVAGPPASVQGSESPSARTQLAEGTRADAAEGRVPLPNSAVSQVAFQVSPPAYAAAEPSAQSPERGTSDGSALMAGNVADEPPTAITRNLPAESTEGFQRCPVELKSLGFVEKADGEVAAILPRGDDGVDIVRQGERFAGHYRALGVSAEEVQAVEDLPKPAAPLPFESLPVVLDVPSASASLPPMLSTETCSACRPNEVRGAGELPDADGDDGQDRPAADNSPLTHRQDRQSRPRENVQSQHRRHEDPATFIFQTLGYVETQDGQRQAVVADGSQVYLVKDGDTFAGRYRVTSVDQLLVLAVRDSSLEDGDDLLSAQTKRGGKSASKSLHGYLHFPSSESAIARNFHEVDASGSPILMNLGVDFFSPSLAGFDGQPHFVMADDPKLGF
jgi:hypothetical protein